MADAADSKSVNGDIVRVQVPPPAWQKSEKAVLEDQDSFFCPFIVQIQLKIDKNKKKISKNANNSFQIMKNVVK